MAMDSETRKLLEEVWSTPLFESIFTRRSRRFGLGMEIPRGPNAYKSTAEPLPLSFEEEALLCMAATGMSGMTGGPREGRSRGSQALMARPAGCRLPGDRLQPVPSARVPCGRSRPRTGLPSP